MITCAPRARTVARLTMTTSPPRRSAVLASALAIVALGAPAGARAHAGTPAYAPDHVVIAVGPRAPAAVIAASLPAPGGGELRVVAVAPGSTVAATLAGLRRRPGVRSAVPDYEGHIAGGWVPDDPGYGGPGGWQKLQWDFAGPWGVDAPDAWAHLIAAHHPGGQGVTVAVLDTGVAYENRGKFRRSPDLAAGQFAAGYDFVAHTHHPDDHLGHGTHVASTIAEQTNNAIGLTGLAYGVRILPVRVLDSQGEGDTVTIAKGIRYAVAHGAQIINLSLEFDPSLTARDVPELISAINFAHRRGVFLAAASGNEGQRVISYPARANHVVAVGSTTEHGCQSDFSNYGRGLSLVAPGGGADAQIAGDPQCHPFDPAGRDIYQVTFTGENPRRFGITDNGYEGTSMATPHVSGAAALVMASGLLGAHPAPDAVYGRLRLTARDLGPPGYDIRYGFGLLDAAAATDPANPAGLPVAPAPAP